MSPIQNSTTVNAPNAPQAVRPVSPDSVTASFLENQSQISLPNSPLTLKLALQEAMQVLLKSMEQALTHLDQALEVFPDDLRQLVQQKMADTLFPEAQPAISKGVQAGLTSTRHFIDNLSGVMKELDITLSELKTLPQEVQAWLTQQQPENDAKGVKNLLVFLQTLSLAENNQQAVGKPEIVPQAKTNQEEPTQQSNSQANSSESVSWQDSQQGTQEKLRKVLIGLVLERMQPEIKNERKLVESNINQPKLTAQENVQENVQEQVQNHDISQAKTSDKNEIIPSRFVQSEQDAEVPRKGAFKEQAISNNDTATEASETLLKNSLKSLPDILQNLATRLDKFREVQQKLSEPQQQVVQKQLDQGESVLPEPLRQLLSTPDRKELKEALILERWSDASPWLKQSEVNLKTLKSTMQETIKLFQKPGATPEALQPQGAEGAKILTFSLPLMLDPRHTPYPAYVHVYQYDNRDKTQNNDENKSSSTVSSVETWLRICLQTDHLGVVDMLFYLKDQQVDVRIRFPDSEHAREFRAFSDVLRSKFSKDELIIKDLSVFS